jgi:hypothetical protein
MTATTIGANHSNPLRAKKHSLRALTLAGEPTGQQSRGTKNPNANFSLEILSKTSASILQTFVAIP